MISCKCLNVVARLAPEAAAEPAIRFDLDAYLAAGRKPESSPPTTTAPSDNHFLFFKEALGPVRCSSVDVRFDGLLRTVRLFNDWDLSECRNCACCVFARLAPECASSGGAANAGITCLVNSTLMTNEEQLSARMADGNYSAAFGLVLNGSSLSYSDLADKGKLLAKAKSDNRFVQMLRTYMERETEAANERIQRFTEQEFAVLKVKRERAEQDCLVLAKLAHNVPELLRLSSTTNSTNTATTVATGTSSSGGGGGGVRQTTPPTTARVSPGTANSQLETPPPTPEYLPMSTGNSPPMTGGGSGAVRIRNGGGSNAITPPSSADHSQQRPVVGFAPNRTASFNNNGRHQQQHSSTNSTTMTTTMQLHRIAATSSIEDCMFDIDGMENADKSPLSNTLSDEEELGFDDTIGNNNDDGIYIPSRGLGRQNSSIAKSLPISMPQVMTQFRANEEDYEEMTEDNVDIAASIKALARSVHGDTVFGDLPRPQVQRFSTQI